MKKVITILALAITTYGFSQTKSLQGEIDTEKVKVEGVSITVTADSAEEVKSTFTVEDIETIFKDTAPDTDITFKLVCNRDENTNSEMSYTIKGNSDDFDIFIERVKKVRVSAIKYFEKK